MYSRFCLTFVQAPSKIITILPSVYLVSNQFHRYGSGTVKPTFKDPFFSLVTSVALTRKGKARQTKVGCPYFWIEFYDET